MRTPTSVGLSGSESPLAPGEQQGLPDSEMPERDCFDDDLIDEMLAWEHQTAGIDSGGQDGELVEAEDVRPAGRRDSAARKRGKVKDTKLQVHKHAYKLAETGHSRHKRALDRSYQVLQALQV